MALSKMVGGRMIMVEAAFTFIEGSKTNCEIIIC